MDSFEAVKVVHERILKFEPENIARKILGYVYLQDYPDQEMIRLALGPDNILQNLIEKAKIALNLVPILPPIQYTRFPNVPPRFTNWVHPVDPFFNGSTHEEEMVKTCHYFNKGFCKHGNNCRYSHIQAFPHEEQVFANGSLELLEMEITELLKSRGGSPISIATLPMLYYESFGKTLQAEGYLTESQRHGKAGYSLTKLLACLRNSIRLIDRPHGQHAVILAEDTLKYMGPQTERYDPDTIFSSLHQIYLTFPSESAFSEEDVSNYFSTFGPVQDVRIPCQQRRMFGFVTFLSSETVKIILSKGNPHYICGARVLVKPYREKSKLVERKYNENNESSLHMVTTAELQARSIREQLLEAHRKALEREMMRFSNLKIGPRAHQSYLNNFNDEPKVSEDHITFPSAEQFNYLLNVLNSVPLTDDQESNQGAELPDNPFASVVANSISAII